MFPKGEKPLRVKDLRKILEHQNDDAYIELGESRSFVDGKHGRLANMFSGNGIDNLILYFEDEDKLKKD